MKTFIKAFLIDTSGAAAAEYALILAIVAGGIAAGALALGQSINTALQNAKSYVDTAVPAP